MTPEVIISTIISIIPSSIAVVIGIIIIRQNKILKTQINSQNSIITNMESYSKLIDIEKLKQFVEVREITIKESAEFDKKAFQEKLHEEQLKPLQKEQEQMLEVIADLMKSHILMSIRHNKRSYRIQIAEKELRSTSAYYLEYLQEMEAQIEPDGVDRSMFVKVFNAFTEIQTKLTTTTAILKNKIETLPVQKSL